jgi:hypothetical protein
MVARTWPTVTRSLQSTVSVSITLDISAPTIVGTATTATTTS